MRKTLIGFIAISGMLTGCATVQSLVRSTFPYTATLLIPASSRTGTNLSATSSANSFDQIFTGQGSNTDAVKEIRIASAKIVASNPSNQNLGVIKSIKIYLSRGTLARLQTKPFGIRSAAPYQNCIDFQRSCRS